MADVNAFTLNKTFGEIAWIKFPFKYEIYKVYNLIIRK